MSESAFKAAVEHEARLEILGRLVDEGLTVAEVGERTGMPASHAGYHVAILSAFALAGREGRRGGQSVYRARLDGHPAWVARAVEARR